MDPIGQNTDEEESHSRKRKRARLEEDDEVISQRLQRPGG